MPRALVLHVDADCTVDALDRRVVAAVAVPLADAAQRTALLAAALDAGVGVVLPSVGGGAPYAEEVLDAQLAAGATIALTPGDLPLAEATVAAWNARQGWRPPPQRPTATPRQLYATVAPEVRDADARRDAEALDAYARLDVDGYWIAGLRPADAGRLALLLQQRTGRPAVVADAGGAHLALLACGVAAVAARPDDEAVFHPAILSAVPIGVRYAPVRRRLFTLRPCECGAHPPGEPPAGSAAILAHNRWCLQAECLEAASMAPTIAETRLLARVGRASTLRRELGLTPLSAGAWRGVVAVARELRAGGPAGQLAG